ncbi:MAG: DUF4258 domain-containing protein [Clostridia bacterium]|nr:DUF4258 domain-containing protein [Clostridia bacterium]
MYLIEQFRALAAPSSMVITQHSRKRFAERGIKIQDVCQAIQTGRIIEQYPDDYPFPSCLILGYSEEKAIHVSASIEDSVMYIITAYIPDPAKWEADLSTRKEETK